MITRHGLDNTEARLRIEQDANAERVRDADALSVDVVELMHDILLSGGTYETLLRRLGEPQAAEPALDEIDRFVAGMGPESPAEKLLASQMLLQHAHIEQLLRRCSDKLEPADVKALSGAIGAAMDVFRRQVEAWNRLRRPPMTIQASQANLAYQQIVHLDDTEIVCGTRETPATELPAESGRVGGPATFDRQEPAVGREHGPKDTRR